MARFSFATTRDNAMPLSGDAATGTAFTGWHPEAGTLIGLVLVEAGLFAVLRRYFRHHHGG